MKSHDLGLRSQNRGILHNWTVTFELLAIYGNATVGYLNDAKLIRKRKDTVVAFTREYSRVSYPQGMCVH